MKIISNINNFTREGKKNNSVFKKMQMKLSKNLEDINNNTFNISNTSNIIYNNRDMIQKITNRKGKSINNILLNNEINEEMSDHATTYTNHNSHSPKSKTNNPILSKNEDNKNTFNNSKPKKKVKFNKNFATIIQVQSYKKYNVNKYLNNNNINCSCVIF